MLLLLFVFLERGEGRFPLTTLIQFYPFYECISNGFPAALADKLSKSFQANKLQMGEVVYKHQNNLVPRIYHCYFSNISYIHHYHTRSRTNQNVFTPRPRNTCNQYCKFSVRYAAADFWNKVPLNIKNAASLKSFRKQLKEFLLTSEA